MASRVTGTDAELFGAARRNPSAFVGVFERHFAFIHRFVTARCGTNHADDLTSEVFLVAFRRRSTYDQRWDDARPWLLGIALNVIRSHERRHRRTRDLLRRSRAESPHDQTGDVDDRLDAGAMRRELGEALRGLRRSEAEVFLLSAWSGLTYEEMAQALNVPVGTIRSRLSRARHKLRKALSQLEEAHRGGAAKYET